jgi:Ca2+-binding EF-hand superfamily protein
VLACPHITLNPTQWFDAIDKDGNGQLTPMELQAALQLGRLNFSLATVAHIIRIHDKTGSGTISFDEFGKLHEFLTNVQQR